MSMALEPEAMVIVEQYAFGRVLELGTGSRNGTIALEHSEATHIITVDNLERFYVSAKAVYKDNPSVEPIFCPLVNKSYDLPKDIGMFDTILVDGPQWTKGRDATIGLTIPLLNPDGIMIIDDAKRDAECIDKWVKHFNMNIQVIDTPKGVALLTHAV